MTRYVPDLGLVIGRNAARYREERNLNQNELVWLLNSSGGNWSPAALSLLESRGSRGERLSDIADLCHALNVSVWDLLDGPKEVETQSGATRTLVWITTSLRGPGEGAGSKSEPKWKP